MAFGQMLSHSKTYVILVTESNVEKMNDEDGEISGNSC